MQFTQELILVTLTIAITALILSTISTLKLFKRTRRSRIPVHSGTVIVDGSNVALHRSRKGRIRNIKIMIKALERKGFKVKVIVDASLRYRIDKPSELEELINQGKIIQAPPGTPADYFILKLAEDLNAIVVSNDMYREWWKEFPWARGSWKIVRYIIEGKRVYFYPDIYPTYRPKEEEEEGVIKEKTTKEKPSTLYMYLTYTTKYKKSFKAYRKLSCLTEITGNNIIILW